MNADLARVKAIFLEAVEQHTRDEWGPFLDRACGADPLRQQVQLLLEAHVDGACLLDQGAIAAQPSIDEPLTEAPGTVIGPYKLLEQIGEGGFGVVFMAEQTHPVKRKVALKVIKPGMDTRQVIARFEAERQALALMDHPNIAKVLDAGTTDEGQGSRVQGQNSLIPHPSSLIPSTGRPYFVMELVKGVPITDYCDQHQLAPKQRLELFITVCQAVQHAHQKGIIHRDIKPTNVLVAPHDDQPVVKIIDFGIAKATSGQLTDKTLFTGYAQLIGTPLYMSPEQAAMNAVDVDTRSDIYSLGVLLYELLTGTTPFDKSRLQAAAFDEVRRIIQQEEPPRPSARISTLRNAETAAAAQRPTRWKQRGPTELGELDWIVMKALEKDRNRRYESAGALARDIERHLRNEPVQACPPSNWYRFSKFARRNRREVLAAGAAAVATVAGVSGLGWAWRSAWQAKAELSEVLTREQQRLEDERLETYFQRITNAYRELSADRLGPALVLLNACPKDLRGWEWHYLMRLCRVQPLVISDDDDTEIHGLSFSPDGERIACAGGDGFIRIWNGRTGELLQPFRAHDDSVVCVAFHPDGKYLASRGTGADQRVKVWDLTSGKELFNEPCDLVRKFGSAYTVAFSADGRLLAAGSDGVVKVWDWKNSHLLPRLPGHGPHPIPVAFSPDGRLATGTKGDGVKLWNPETGTLLRTVEEHQGPLSAVAFSADGKWVASASYDRTVKLSDSTTGELLYNLSHPGNQVECVAIGPDGRRLASGCEDNTVRVWDTTTGREILVLRGHTDRCGCVAFSPDPDGHRLASASFDGTIRIWDATPLRGDEHQELLTFTKHINEIQSVAISPDGRQIVSSGRDKFVMVWDAPTGRVSAEFNEHVHPSGDRVVAFCLAWRPQGPLIASGGIDGVRVWDARTGKGVFSPPAAAGKDSLLYSAVAFSPDGRYLATGRTDGALQVWDGETGQPVGAGQPDGLLDAHKREIVGVVFSKGGEHLASASRDGIVKLWDATRLNEKQEAHRELRARVPGPNVNVAFSPDGRWLATGGKENTVVIWDVHTGDEIRTLRGQHSGEVYAVAFSPVDDGRWIATAGEDSAVKIWDSDTGKLIHSFRGHTGLVCCLAFSPDGRLLVSGSRDKTVKVWDMTQLSD